MRLAGIVAGPLLAVACSSTPAAISAPVEREDASSAADSPGETSDQHEPDRNDDAGPVLTTEASGAAVADGSDAPSPEPIVDAHMGDGKVLYVAGEMPMVGVDLQIHDLLRTKNIEVEDVRETVSPARAEGKGLVLISYSVLSTNFRAADFADLPVPLMVMEHFLLADLGMTSAAGHGYEPDVTQISLLSRDPLLSAGLPAGDVTVYSQVGEMFWGMPSSAAMTVATVKGNPLRAVTFAYPAGAMMVGRVAKAKRMQVFVAVHAPPPNPQPFLNADGLRLVGGAIDWCLQP